MKKAVFKKRPVSVILSGMIPVFLTLIITAMIIWGLYRTELSSRAEGLRILDESILRAAVKCYAIEGRYPEDISYIEHNYNIHIDRTRYAVFYQIFADNILPDITVIELNKLQ